MCNEKEGSCGLAEFKDGGNSEELNKKKYWTGQKKHGKNTVYQRDTLIDPDFVDGKGRTNIARMKQGLAPIGPDGHSINLHHVSQSQNGPIAELTRTYHSRNHGSLHRLCSVGCESQIDREAFAAWRRSYWRSRGAEMAARLASSGGKASWNFFPVVGALMGKPSDLKKAAESVDSLVGSVINESTDDLPPTNFLRLLLRVLKPAITSAVRKERALIENAMGILEKCGFDPKCVAAMSIKRALSTSGAVAANFTKKYVISERSPISYVRVVAETSLSVSLNGVSAKLAVNGDTAALVLPCKLKAGAVLSIEAPLSGEASYSIVFGDELKCSDKSVAEIVSEIPDMVLRTAEDNRVGGIETNQQQDNGVNAGMIAGIVVGALVLIAVVVLLFVLLKKGVIPSSLSSSASSSPAVLENAEEVENFNQGRERLLPEETDY